MPKLLIHPSKSLGYTDLYLDFVNGRVKGKPFYLADQLGSVADQLDRVDFNRSDLVSILKHQNKQYEAGKKTFENIERLAEPRSVCVFAGQQAGLFGGPMFTIIKALGIIKAAERYEQELGRPVIPIFWIAGDDHDFDEANHTSLLDRSSELHTIKYTTAPEQEIPVARIRLDDEEALYQAKAAVRDCCGETEFTQQYYDLLDKSYTTDDTFVTAFGKLLSGLTGERGLVLFCPTDDRAKRVAAPFFKKIVNLQDDLHATESATNEEIKAAGFHIQVEKKDISTHLFYELNGRQPVLRENGNFIVGDLSLTKEELLARIDEQPERFSPDVMTRPILQSFLFPTIAQKGGPSEIAYFAQVNRLFTLFGITPPVHQARPTATIVEARFEKLLAEWKINFGDLFGDIEQVINRVMGETFPSDLEEKFRNLTEGVEDQFKSFINDALEFDDSLKQVARQVYGKIDYNIKNFEQKLFAAHKRKSNELRERIYRMYHALCPNRGFQERSINAAYFVSRYGFGFIQFLYDQLDSEESAHQLIYLSEYTDK